MHGRLWAVPVMVMAAVVAVPSAASATPETSEVLDVQQLPGASGRLAELAPGDRTEWAAQVTNTGDDPVPLYASFATTGVDALVTDPENGLQLSVELCPDPLVPTTVGGGSIVFTCPTGTTAMGTGSAADLGTLQATSALDPGRTVGVRVRLQLPATAGNAFENTEGQLHARFATTGRIPGTGGGPDPGGEPDPGGGPGTDGEPGTDGWPGPGGSLAETGRNLLAVLAGATAALVGGATLLAVSRRRSRQQERGA